MTDKVQKNKIVSEEGNTKTSSESKCKRWCFTLNNYTNDELNNLITFLTTKKALFIIGKEIGEEEKTPHLQCYAEFNSQMRFATLKKHNDRLHIEKTKGNREQNLKYCDKDNDYISNFPIHKMLLLYKNITWKTWQQSIINLIENTPEERTINWVYDPIGNSGKSFLVKYLYLKYDIMITNGKSNDVFNQLLQRDLDNKNTQNIVIDVPRCVEDKYISYQAIEKLKDGLFYSGKYEGGIVCIPTPTLIIMSNHLPDIKKMSKDRWNIVQISGDETELDEYLREEEEEIPLRREDNL